MQLDRSAAWRSVRWTAPPPVEEKKKEEETGRNEQEAETSKGQERRRLNGVAVASLGPLLVAQGGGRLGSQRRHHDVVLYGATSFTAKWALRYLNSTTATTDIDIQPGKKRRRVAFAIAGRREKEMRQLGAQFGLGPLSVIVCSLNDDASCAERVAQEGVAVINFAGPVSEFGGEALVAACVEQRTHYVDLSGEIFWQRHIIDLYHDRALEAGVKIVSFGGMASTGKSHRYFNRGSQSPPQSETPIS